ncbi:hypothetical protein BFJ66_g13474 [Fusarium oxysporum f. sp. cepae]|uniref:Uncharacterized protein n=1 Tax=Fusarium oxysporum f. sp. cepae TaxID=396571 RepID=A0A3L6P8V6_FUSOX|nr:hypothetical protein BFJ65_g1665 [Fusarium oxysporum f. sp. cepae]RKK34775.1 hypothetical protein BFJ67_g13591 [Fusarium oxysporum f. sp. cepae]RKK36443.1 hypothetical protein BFJ66_g13474 [Fusarium oxysporum f. sp. cepae]
MSSPRLLTQGAMAQVIQQARDPQTGDPVRPLLGKGEMRLYSFYKPSLQAKDYTINATQTITSGTQKLTLYNTKPDVSALGLAGQRFEVIVPRFSLDTKLINTYYPPDGHQDEARILPHIVLNDPHYPWEISAGVTANMTDGIDFGPIVGSDGKTETVARSMVPWVALLVFDPDDLRLTDIAEAKALGLPGFTSEVDLKTQTPNGTFSMTVADYFANITETSRINYAAGYKDPATGNLPDPLPQEYDEILRTLDKTNVIFPQKSLVKKLFTDSTKADTATNKYGVEQYKYMSHVREINTEGCPDAGVQEQGIFSVVIASRSGALRDKVLVNNVWTELPTNISQPRTQVCHLVSIEHLDSTIDTWTTDQPSQRIGMISLFSWIYTALPPNPVNFVTTVRNLTENQQMLRVDDKVLAGLDLANKQNTASGDNSIKSQVSTVLADRLRIGYTISRWRTQTGEETSAFTRGPLVPLPTPAVPAPNTIQDCSFTSQDYQILDSTTGMMDLSYSSAWQLGKLLAISDTTFSSALMRFRSLVRNASVNSTMMKANNMTAAADVVASVKSTISNLKALATARHEVPGTPQRVRPPSTREAITSVSEAGVALTFQSDIEKSVGSNTAAGQDSKGTPIPYNGFNLQGPNNSDWVIIHDWLADKLSLGGIPSHYLLPEPSFLPAESLRFFYIDDFWLDCLLDGALSVANHLDADDDVVRRQIKTQFNTYLSTPVPDAGYKPQVPCYGFFIRSKVIKAMPDMKISVTWKNPDKRYPVCRWTKWDDQTLMCLLDRQPQELDYIELSQPQHQQRFALGEAIDATGSGNITFLLRTLFTVAPGISPDGAQVSDDMSRGWLDWDSRGIKIRQLAMDVNQQLNKAAPGKYVDPTPNSCETGLELNDPRYYFTIVPPPGVDSTPVPRDRQLFIRNPSSTPSPPQPPTPPPSKPIKPGEPSGLDLPPTVPPPAATQKPPTTLSSVPSPAHQRPHTSTPAIIPQPTNKLLVTQLASSSIRSFATPQSRYDMKIYVDYRDPPKRFPGPFEKYSATDYIPTKNNYYFDLIFSIRKRPSAITSDYKLLKVVIDIPIESVPKATNKEALLTPNYDGPGVRMLNNQRFVPFLFTDEKLPMLHAEVVPRSSTLDDALQLNDFSSSQLSFRLAEANISPVNVVTRVVIDGQVKPMEVGKVFITWTEWYSTPASPAGEPVINHYTLLKQSVTDD